MKSLFKLLPITLLMIGLTACSSGDQADETTSVSKADRQAAKSAEMVPDAVAQADVDQNVATCRAATRKLAETLKPALQAAMKEGGPLNALNVCHDEAQVISDRICDEEGLTISRTSRKFRNPGNAPDEWEKAGLEAFSARIAAGEMPKDLEMWATVTGAHGEQTFRYLKAIPTAPMCLKCHGSELAPEVDEKLVELYPDDHARGFAVGDMRGAFSVKMDLPRSAVSGG